MEQELKTEFLQHAQRWGISVSEDHFNQLWNYWRILEWWNRTINLVSVKQERDFFLRHVLDAIVPLPFFPSHGSSLLDLGTGAGLPGIPLKILRPSLKLTLIDSSRRRTSFLREVVRQLSLREVAVVNDRAENLRERNKKFFFDIVISRATWKLSSYLELATPFLSPQGSLIAMKGEIPLAEWTHTVHYMENKRIFLAADFFYTLPLSPRKRRVLIFKKLNDNE